MILHTGQPNSHACASVQFKANVPDSLRSLWAGGQRLWGIVLMFI